MKQVVLATGNPGKVRELAELLQPLNLEILPQSQFGVASVAETGTTFVENAIIKARHAASVTGLAAIADDSGLEVDYLNGAPGIYSSRFAGEDASDRDNLDKLLARLKGVPMADRRARFRCVLVYMGHADDPTPLICQGTWEGRIAEQPSGDGGFGYDPVFFVPTEQCTAAELDKHRKGALSHRGQALRQLIAQLADRQF